MNEAAFLAEIVANPDEDVHRLVYADWLDDHGEGRRAQFIRDQVELARMDEADPRYPSVLARTRRAGVLTGARRLPMIDHVPGGRVMFHRGLIAGVSIANDDYLRHSSERWGLVPLEQLSLLGPRGASEEWVGRTRGWRKLQRLRTLRFAWYVWRVEHVEPLLTEGTPLTGLRALRLPPYLSLGELVQRLALPALDSLAAEGLEGPEDWEECVPADGPPLRRIALTGQARHEDDWEWDGPPLDWLLRSRHGPALEEAILHRKVFTERDVWYDAAAPLRDPSLLKSSRLRHLETDGESVPRLLDEPDWGPLEALGIHRRLPEEALDRLLATPRARRLRSLSISPADPYFADHDFPHLRAGEAPAWRRLRLVDWPPDLLRACSRHLLRFALNDDVYDLAALAREGIEFPELRELRLDFDELPRGLAKFVAGLKAPNLCTLVLTGQAPPRAAAIRALAQAKGTPHLSLVGAGEHEPERWWVLGDGEVRPVARGVLPLYEDWWSPLPGWNG